jgi:hypothetical protein
MIPRPTTVDLFGTFEQFVFGFQTNGVSTILLSLWPITLIFGFLALQRHARMRSETEYFMLATFTTILLAFGVSFAVTPVFLSRYLVSALPALYLCLLALFESFPSAVGRISRITLVILMLFMLGIEITSTETPVKEDYRAASIYLENHAQPQDIIIVSAPFTIYPIEYYYHGSTPLTTLPIWNQYAFGSIPSFSNTTLPAEVASTTAPHQTTWLLLSYDQGYQHTIFTYFESHFKRLYTKTFSPGLSLYVYKIRYDTPLSSRTYSF